jgi:hypothetical protein
MREAMRMGQEDTTGVRGLPVASTRGQDNEMA